MATERTSSSSNPSSSFLDDAVTATTNNNNMTNSGITTTTRTTSTTDTEEAREDNVDGRRQLILRLAQECIDCSADNDTQTIIQLATQCHDLFLDSAVIQRRQQQQQQQVDMDAFHAVLRSWAHTSQVLSSSTTTTTTAASKPAAASSTIDSKLRHHDNKNMNNYYKKTMTTSSSSTSSVTAAAAAANGIHVEDVVVISTAQDAAKRATKLLLDMEELATQQQQLQHNGDDSSYVQDANNSTTTTDTTTSSCDSSGIVICPNTESYNYILKAWQRSNAYDAPYVCEALVRRMQQHDEDDNNNVQHRQPDDTSYRYVLEAWASHAGILLDTQNDDEDEDDDDDNNKLDCLERMRQIQRHMQHEYEQSQQQQEEEDSNDTRSTTIRTDNTNGGGVSVVIKPTIQTTNCIIKAHANRIRSLRKRQQRQRRGEQQQQQQEGGGDDERMQYAKDAHVLLNEMKNRYAETNDGDYEVTAQTYAHCMEAYGQCGLIEATACAEQLFKELQHAYQDTNCTNVKLQPTTRAYTALITAWANTRSYKSPHRAEAILKEMQQVASSSSSGQEADIDDGDDDNVNHNRRTTSRSTSFAVSSPTARTYTKVIQAWARSRDPTKPQRALRILKHMKAQDDVHARPTLVTYNAAIDACARCSKQQGPPSTTDQHRRTEALKIAFAIFKTIEKDPTMVADHLTYSTLLRATAFLLPPGTERNTVATALFKKARTAGMVTPDLVKTIRKAVDNQVMEDLLFGGGGGENEHEKHHHHYLRDRRGQLDYSNIPPSWSRNVR